MVVIEPTPDPTAEPEPPTSEQQQADPPPAPTGLMASQVAHDSVTLSWTAPSSGSTVTGYKVLRGTDANSLSAIAQDTGNAGAEYTDSTVAAETTYYYAVLALSADGDGAQSATVSATTPAAPGSKKENRVVTRQSNNTPSAPQNLSVQAGNGSLIFSWTAPASDGGSAITRYTYTLTVTATGVQFLDIGNCESQVIHTGTNTILGNLTNGTEYTFSVRACNANGEGAAATFNGTPMLPPPPAFVSATVNGYALVMTFDQTIYSFSSSSLTNDPFTVKRTRNGAESRVTLTDRPRIRGKTVTLTLSSPLLTTDTSIKVSYDKPETGRIENTQLQATGSFSDRPVTNNTPNTAPGPPQDFTIVAGDAKATLNWKAPTTAGTTITHYQYRHAAGTSVPAATAWQSTSSGFVTTARITGLTNATAYAFEVRAVNANGNSSAATASATPQANSPITGSVGIVGPIRVPGRVSWDFQIPFDLDGDLQALIDYQGGRGGYEFQWLRVDGATETAITGATSGKYTLTSADVGKKLKFRLSFEDDRGNAESLTGAAFPSGETIQATAACPAPTYTGGAVQLWTSDMTLDLSSDFKYHGFYAGTNSDTGALDDRSITTRYTINAFQQHKPDATTNEIRLDLNRRLAAADEKRFTLYVCDTPLRFADASYSSSGHRYTWDNASDRVDLFEHGVRTLYVSDVYDVRESSGNDFPHDADTTAIVSVGTVSGGRMSYPEDGDPWADYGKPGWGDMFRLVGLEPRKTYRVEVDFNRVANTVGGSIQMYICCNHGPDPYAVSEWDSNYDGRAIFDFDTGWTVGATFVSVIPGNSMKPDVWEFGSYTVTLTDVTGLRRLVSNTSQRPIEVLYEVVGDITGTNAQQAISFRTGSNPNGYTLDRVTAYIRRAITDSSFSGVPKVAIHRNATGDLPGAKLCNLQMLADYETGLSLSNGDWPDRLYAPDCADNTLAASTPYWVVFSEGSSPAGYYAIGDAKAPMKTRAAPLAGVLAINVTRSRVRPSGPKYPAAIR